MHRAGGGVAWGAEQRPATDRAGPGLVRAGHCGSRHDATRYDAYPAHRISVGSDGGEEVPVGFPGVEKGADSVVREVAEPERDAFVNHPGFSGGSYP